MSVEELLRTGGSSEKQKVQDLQRELQSDDPINIQFTSVSADRGVARIFQRGGGPQCVKVRVLTRLSLWPRYRHGIFRHLL